MTDPLRPFSSLIESITRVGRASQSTGMSTQKSIVPGKSANANNAQLVALSLPERLGTRLSVIDKADRKRRRHVFIEVALLSELGEQLAMDHDFSELVEEVCTVIAADKHMMESLDTLLDQFAT